MIRHPARPAAVRGFTLLEVIVAFAIAAISLTALLAIFSTGLRNTRVSQEYSVAIEFAQSKLAQIGAEDSLEPGEWDGKFDDKYSWRTTITEYQVTDGQLPASLHPYLVTVQVNWRSIPRPRSLTLHTMKLKTGL